MYSADICRTFFGCSIIKVFLYGLAKLIKCFSLAESVSVVNKMAPPKRECMKDDMFEPNKKFNI